MSSKRKSKETAVSEVLVDKSYNFRHRKTISYNEFDLMKIGMQTTKEAKPEIKNLLSCDTKASKTTESAISNTLPNTSHSLDRKFKSSQNEGTFLDRPVCSSKDAVISIQSSSKDTELKTTQRANCETTMVKPLRKSVWFPCMETPNKSQKTYKRDDHLKQKIIHDEKDDEYRPSCFVYGFDSTTKSLNAERQQHRKTAVSLKSDDKLFDKNVYNRSNSTFDYTFNETNTVKYKRDKNVETSKETLTYQSFSKVDTRKDVKNDCSHVEMDFIPLQQKNGRARGSAVEAAFKGQPKSKLSMLEPISSKQPSVGEHNTSVSEAANKNLSPVKCPSAKNNISRKRTEYDVCQNSRSGHAKTGNISTTNVIQHTSTSFKTFEDQITIRKTKNMKFDKDGYTKQQKAKGATSRMYSRSSSTNSVKENFMKTINQRHLDNRKPESSELEVEKVIGQNKYTSNSFKGSCKRYHHPCKLSTPLRKICNFCGSMFSKYTDLEAHELIVHNYSKVKRFKFGNPKKRGCPDSTLEEAIDSQLDSKGSATKIDGHANKKGKNSELKKNSTLLSENKYENIYQYNSRLGSRFQTAFRYHKTSSAYRIKSRPAAVAGCGGRHNRYFYPRKASSLLNGLVCNYCCTVFCRYSDLEAHKLIVHNQSTVKRFKYGNPRKRFPESLMQEQIKCESYSEFPDEANNLSVGNRQNNRSTSYCRYFSNQFVDHDKTSRL